ncbi:FAD binding domain-containing protein [Embleya sp. NBC_00896]|uniref:FAD binding domain-containing protein n=1 Tax=Embleya sp. NBC_00896 TaxID=2975961 RepID=UPI0038636E9F|nr:xanthine dehydrogenase family protein subunit M [Embleya sp. NBC_00896]
MRPFTYTRPDQPAQAWAELGPDAMYIAGGTNLVDLMKSGVTTPGRLVDIGRLPLAEIETDGDTLRVGALVPNSDLAAHPVVRERLPVLSQALLAGASPQLRNLATIGGNLMQRTRCGYFRDTAMPCNKREPGTGCAALDGDHRGHAVLGTSPQCIATHPSDLAVALVALDALVRIDGPNGPRVLPLGAFHLPPADTPERETALVHGELITGVEVPMTAVGAHSHYLKVRERAAFAFAMCSAAVALDVHEGTVRSARIALGGVATTPWRAHTAEQALIGVPPGTAAFARAADAATEGAAPRRDNAYKVELIRRVVARALTTLAPLILDEEPA